VFVEASEVAIAPRTDLWQHEEAVVAVCQSRRIVGILFGCALTYFISRSIVTPPGTN